METPPTPATNPALATRKPWSNLAVSVLSLTAIGVIVALSSYFMARDPMGGIGSVMFLLVPFLTGFPIGYAGKTRLAVTLSLALTGIITLTFLIILGQEGWICCFMALPIILLGLLPGALLGRFWRMRLGTRANGLAALTLLLAGSAVVLTGAAEMEKPHRSRARSETFESRVFLPVPADRAWRLIDCMDRLDADMPFLLRIGLPVPVRCEMVGEGVGRKRTCIFDQGRIEQEVTSWNPPHAMGLKITESTLPGRRWLGFQTAHYDFLPVQGGTEVIRKTEISSRLFPRWYWRPLEGWGVRSEHRYVLASVRRAAR